MTSAMTPTEIDTVLASLHLQYGQADHRRTSVVDSMHRDLGHERHYNRGGRGYYRELAMDTVAQARAELAAATRPEWELRSLHLDLERYEAATAEIDRITAEMAPLNAEYDARPWPRFFTVQQTGGHVHSSMHCSTCNRGRERTAFVWNPELSGLTEAEAVDKLGPHLCTVCYPSAPVEYTQGVADPDTCPGSGRGYAEGTYRRNWSGGWGKCRECGTNQVVTTRGVIRKHKQAKTATAA